MSELFGQGATGFGRPVDGSRAAAAFLRAAVVAAAILFAALIAGNVERADAAMQVDEFTTQVSTSQAGGHPDVSMTYKFTNREATFDECQCEDVKILDTHFPTGFIGNPHAVTRCQLDSFARFLCPPASQVGIVDIGGGSGLQAPIFNLVPHPGEPGLIGFNVPIVDAPAFVVLHARTGSDYGLDATSSPIFHLLPINELRVHMWGVPAASSHDVNRWPPEQRICIQQGPYPAPCFGTPVPAEIAPRPYLQNPTTCGVPLVSSLDAHYYEGTIATAEAPWPTTTGCDLLTFNPSLSALPTTNQADTPAGLDVELSVPQTQSPTVPSPSELKEATVTLPEGFTINPTAADGKEACTDVQGAFGTEAPANCPENAKIGTLTIDSSALPAPIDGAIYLGESKPGDKYRLFLAASGFSTHVKLAGSVRPDPATGRLVVTFPDLPQSPFSEFDMHFFGSERGLMATPTQCGSYEVRARFVPWDGELEAQESTSAFSIDAGPGGSPCPGPVRPFSPTLQAGSADNTASAVTPLKLQVTRRDGDQNLDRLRIDLPPGLVPAPKGVAYCPEPAIAGVAFSPGLSELAAPSCPVSSLIGTVASGQGAGSKPLHVSGRVYLAGPYNGAPLSILVVVPAVSGPYDLGTVAVRAAAHVDPTTAQVSVASDAIPQIIDGIPLRIRSLQFRIDRPDFTRNPTNCDPFAVGSAITGNQGGLATPSTHFQVANCTDLGFAPRLATRLSGATKRAGHPTLRTVLKTKRGDANISRVSVALPPTTILDNSNIGSSCTRPQLAADSCPANSVYGHAVARTPLLDGPLEGNVYLAAGDNRLPDLVIALRGQIDINLRGRIDTAKNSGIRTTFETVPDAAVESFQLTIPGGKDGLLINSENVCSIKPRATIRMRGQNGKTTSARQRLRTPCGKKLKRAKRHRRAGR
jgi:hypothetical protein